MIDRQTLIVEFLRRHIADAKTGVIVKGLKALDPAEVARRLAKTKSPLHAAIIGYGDVPAGDDRDCELSDSIEKAVLWRSDPNCAGRILVFINSDVVKLHSLAEFDSVSTRDLSRFLLELQLQGDHNAPTQNFWEALRDSSDYYAFDALYEFVSAVSDAPGNPAEAIPENMWRLNLLADGSILGAAIDPKDRLAENRDLIFAIGQLREDARKKLSRSLARTKTDAQEKLKKAYRDLQSFYKRGDRESLKALDFATVQELFYASSHKGETEKAPRDRPLGSSPLRQKDLDKKIADAIVSGGEDELGNVKELCDELIEHYDQESEGGDGSVSPVGGIFGDRTIVLDKHQPDLRRLVGKFCNLSAWGGLMETDESVLKDAISADVDNAEFFAPDSPDSRLSSRGDDGSRSLFAVIEQYDKAFDEKGLEAERFAPIISELKVQRAKLHAKLDMLMYQPVLLFGASEESRQDLVNYIDAWGKLYHALCANEPEMRKISSGGTNFIARAVLSLDFLYVRTPKEWKAVLLPLHPLYLWRFYEVFRSLAHGKSVFSDEDKAALAEVLSQLPQVLSFIIANDVATGSAGDRVLPCSGSIEMLPTFENKTNRYLGNDGMGSIKEILTRWIGFAPYTRNEIRICSVDAPDLTEALRQVKDFMDEQSCRRVVYDVYFTRDQNGNTELAKLDYAGKDHEIGEYIKKERIAISVRNVRSSGDVKAALESRPVHVAFYFDQSSYAIEFGPTSRNLYITPLVITYDYEFDEIQRRGSIFPSSDTDSGLIGDYHKLLRSADVISNNMSPRTTYNGSADMTSVVSTVQDARTQWLVVADRDTNNYQPTGAIPIGEMQHDKRMVNVWASDQSRIVAQYRDLLREYSLEPKGTALIGLLRQFGHIASNGLISIPKSGADAKAIDNNKKGLLGTLFAAAWYAKTHEGDDALVASLDDDRAKIWLQNRKLGNERADLVGLYYEKERNLLHVQPIEVKTRADSFDASISRGDVEPGKRGITGHAADQIAFVVEALREIFQADENAPDMFTSARREVLKYQIVSECFRTVHDADWQKRWHDILKRAFANYRDRSMEIDISGILVHVKLNEASGEEHIVCIHPDFDDCRIDYWKLTTKEIQRVVLGDEVPLEGMRTGDSAADASNGGERRTDMNEDARVDSDVAGGFFEENDRSSAGTEAVAEARDACAAASFVTEARTSEHGVGQDEIKQLVRDFKRACGDYHVALKECEAEDTVVGPSVIRLKFRLGRGQSLQGLSSHLQDIGREMKRTGVIVQQVPNSDELLLDVARLKRELVLFKDVVGSLPPVVSPEQLPFPLGRTPDGKDLIKDLGEMPHMLVGGSTGSGKSVFLFTMLASILMTHPRKEDLQLVLSSSKLEDFIHFEGLPHLYSGRVISDAAEATQVIKEVIFKESDRRGQLLAESRVANISEYNKIPGKRLAPFVVVIDEFADLADQLETKKEQNAFYKPVQRIAATGRSRGIHLVICTQRPEAKLVPPTTKAQLNGRVALRVNDGISSRMIIESPDAQYLQKHGDMIYKNGDVVERAQGYLIEIPELDAIVRDVVKGN